MSRCRLVTIFRFNFILKSVGGSRVTEKRYRSTKQRKNHKNTPFYSNTSYLWNILDIHPRIFHVTFTQGHDYMVLTTTSFKWIEHVKDDIYLQAACLPLLQVFPVVPAGLYKWNHSQGSADILLLSCRDWGYTGWLGELKKIFYQHEIHNVNRQFQMSSSYLLLHQESLRVM